MIRTLLMCIYFIITYSYLQYCIKNVESLVVLFVLIKNVSRCLCCSTRRRYFLIFYHLLKSSRNGCQSCDKISYYTADKIVLSVPKLWDRCVDDFVLCSCQDNVASNGPRISVDMEILCWN